MLSKTKTAMESKDNGAHVFVSSFGEQKISLDDEQAIECLNIRDLDGETDREANYYLPIYPLLTGNSNTITLFLDNKDDLGEGTIPEHIHRGFFSINLNYKVPSRFVKKSTKRLNALETSVKLVKKTDEKEEVIKEVIFNADSDMLFEMELSADLCTQLLDAKDGKPGNLYLKSRIRVYIRRFKELKFINSYVSLSKFFKLFNGNQKQASIKVNYKYFDTHAASYLDFPDTFSFNGEKRDIAKKKVPMFNGKTLVSPQLNIKADKLATVSPWNLVHAGNFNEKIKLFTLDQWRIDLNGLILDLPIVDSSSSDFWINRKDPKAYLAVPTFSIVSPELNATFDTAPFSFIFHNKGALDMNGKPVIEGEIKLTLNSKVSSTVTGAVKAAQADATVTTVTAENIVYNLKIPYTDNQGAEQYLIFSTQDIKATGPETTELTFRFGNDSVRLCYAMIASDNNQNLVRKAELAITYYFKGYTPVQKPRFDFANIIGAKISALPFIKSKALLKNEQDYFDASKNKLVKTNGQEIVFKDSVSKLKRRIVGSLSLAASNMSHSVLLAQRIHPVLEFAYPIKIEPILVKTTYFIQTFVRNISLECYFPCNVFGNFYQESNGTDWSVVGCKETYRLGEPPNTLYSELADLRHAKFKVYRSRLSPNNFLIVPTNYIIARYEETEETDKKFKPCIYLYSTINEVDNTSSWVLDITLMPDLSWSERTELDHALKAYTPYTPEVNFISEIQTKNSAGTLSIAKMPGTQVSAFPLEKDIRITIQTNIESILILLEMLKNNAINGSFQFTQLDDIQQVIVMKPVLNHIAGTWSSGHFQISKNADQLSFINRTESTVVMEKLRFYLEEEPLTQDVERTDIVEPGATLTVELAAIPAYKQVVPYYTVLEKTNITIEEVNKYIEDVTCQLIFIASFDFDAQQIKTLNVKYRLRNTTKEFSVLLNKQNNNAEAEFLLPLTEFLIERVVEYKLDAIEKLNNEVVDLPDQWTVLDISVEGNIVNITSNKIINN
jgi:hypothetical protein